MTPRYLFFFLLLALSNAGFSQLIVDGKNVNDDVDVEYIQFSFHYEPRNLDPVYVIDYGAVLTSNREFKQQKIIVNDKEVTAAMTPVYVLNQLFKAGWEYTGDVIYMKAPIFENSQIYTFRRKHDVRVQAKNDGSLN